MQKCRQENKVFDSFGLVHYATDVTFQQSNKQKRNTAEGKVYFSGKDSLYGYKAEVFVISTGLAVGCSLFYPGSVADIQIFREE